MNYKLNITEVEDLLADSFVRNQKPMNVKMTKYDDQGNINIEIKTNINTEIKSSEIDFELSPCECVDFDQLDINDYKNKTIFTSSALELFEFLLIFNESVNCLMDFEGVSWRVMIV